MKKMFNDIEKINENIKEAEILLKEAMNFCEDDSIEEPETDEESVMEPEMDDMSYDDIEMDGNVEQSVDSYVDHIRKYSLNGLSALCDNPESEEYQMLKKIFQMCDKKPEKKEGINESKRLFGVLKENKEVVFETIVNNSKDFKELKNTLISEAISRGFNPTNIRLVSETKIIK